MIKAKNLFKTFHNNQKEITVLKGVDLDVREGEFLMIMGRSGAGKSTLMYQLGLLDHPTSGSIVIDGRETTHLSTEERTTFRREKLGYIFQDYALVPELTALENIILPMMMKGLKQKNIENIAHENLEKVGIAGKSDNLPGQLSGGEQQRVSVARAIAHKPKIIFADEPTANLDTENSLKVVEIFSRLNKEGQTIVMVTHEPEYAKYAHRVVTLEDGEIISEKIIREL